jgi:hypothetical protein
MPHFKCVTCRTRLFTAGEPADVCDGCGSAFEPVAELLEIVGYRAITSPVPSTGPRWVDDEGLAAAVAIALRDRETR